MAGMCNLKLSGRKYNVKVLCQPGSAIAGLIACWICLLKPVVCCQYELQRKLQVASEIWFDNNMCSVYMYNAVITPLDPS